MTPARIDATVRPPPGRPRTPARRSASAPSGSSARVTVLVVVVGIIGVAVIAKNSQSHGRGRRPPSADPNAPLPAGRAGGRRRARVRRAVRHRDRTRPSWRSGRTSSARRARRSRRRTARASSRSPTQARSSSSGGPPPSSTRTSATTPPLRAVAAWGCAIDAGKSREFHNAVYRQPAGDRGRRLHRRAADRLRRATPASPAPTSTPSRRASPTAPTLAWAANSTAVFYSSQISGHAVRPPQRGRGARRRPSSTRPPWRSWSPTRPLV